MTGRNSAVSSASPPKPPQKSSRNAPHPTTRKRPRETLRPFAPRTQTFGVSGCRRCLRRVANARKFQEEERSMKHYAGLDVSIKETAICIVEEAGRICREMKVVSHEASGCRFWAACVGAQPYGVGGDGPTALS